MLTLELRWFVAGGLGDERLRAFADGGELEHRSDRYLWGTGPEHGVKQRGEDRQLEDKARLSSEPFELALAGRPRTLQLERWRKRWPGESAAVVGPNPRWVLVEKHRALRQLRVARAELTRLEFDGEGLAAAGLCAKHERLVHHSFAVETRPGARSELALRAELAELVNGDEALAAIVDAGLCCGYPAWLARSLAEAEA